MKRILLLLLLASSLAVAGHAQQSTAPQDQEIIVDAETMRMLHQELMNGMSDIIARMNETMAAMGRMVETATPLLLQEMAELMTEMSITLQDMAEQRSTGAALGEQVEELQERLRAMRQMMDRMEKQAPNQ